MRRGGAGFHVREEARPEMCEAKPNLVQPLLLEGGKGTEPQRREMTCLQLYS